MKKNKIHDTLCSKNKKELYFRNIILLVILLIGHSRLSKLNIKIMTFGALLSTAIDIASTNGMIKGDGFDLITGTERKFVMYINNYHLQISPNGIVNGTDDKTKYTMIQKKAEKQGTIKFIGIATCLYLCMNSCGYLYGSLNETKNCIFYENIDDNYYNTYASVRWSNNQRMLFLGLDNEGNPKVNILKLNNYKLGNAKKHTQALPLKPELHTQKLLEKRLKKKNIKCDNTVVNDGSLIKKIKHNKNAGKKFCHQASNKKNNKNKLSQNFNDSKNKSFDKTVVSSFNNSNDSSIDEVKMTNEFNKYENKTTNLVDSFNHEEMMNNDLDVDADSTKNRYRRLSFPFANDDWNNQSSISNSSVFSILKNLYDVLINPEAILDDLHEEEDYEHEEDDYEHYKNGDFNISNIAVQLIPVT